MLGCLFLLLRLTGGIFSRLWIRCLFLLAFVHTFSKTSIPSLIHIGSPVISSSSKADVLNQYFSCFNRSTATLPPLAHNLYPSLHDNSPDFLCNPDEICNLISHIPIETASGPYSISSIMLHNRAPSISLPSLIFNSSLSTGIFPSDWKNSQYHTFSQNQKPLLHPLQTNALSLYFPFQVRSWNFTS